MTTYRYSAGTTPEREPTRRKRRYGNSRLSSAQVEAAHFLYWEQKLSLNQLGAMLYRKLGYPRPRTCTNALRTAFLRDGLAIRSLSEASRIRNATRNLELQRQRDGRWLPLSASLLEVDAGGRG